MASPWGLSWGGSWGASWGLRERPQNVVSGGRPRYIALPSRYQVGALRAIDDPDEYGRLVAIRRDRAIPAQRARISAAADADEFAALRAQWLDGCATARALVERDEFMSPLARRGIPSYAVMAWVLKRAA